MKNYVLAAVSTIVVLGIIALNVAPRMFTDEKAAAREEFNSLLCQDGERIVVTLGNNGLLIAFCQDNWDLEGGPIGEHLSCQEGEDIVAANVGERPIAHCEQVVE